MKIAPAFQLLMKAAAKATALKNFNLNLPHNPFGSGAELQKKFKRTLKKTAPSPH
jgi:hypothetical protein